MLYEAVRLGSQIYRCELRDSNIAYRKLLNSLDANKWNGRCALDKCEVGKVRAFVNSTWRARMRASSEEILPVLQDILPRLEPLRGKSILEVDFDEIISGESVSDLICRSFKGIANCHPCKLNEATATSKVLHIINPELFPLWDRPIRCGYGGYDWIWYTDFLRRIQRLANLTLAEVMEQEGCSKICQAVKHMTRGEYSLVKTIDEYNYMKFTRNHDDLWVKEYDGQRLDRSHPAIPGSSASYGT